MRDIVLLDTRAVATDQQYLSGPDQFPDDCLLVVITPEQERRYRRELEALPYSAGPGVLVERIIDQMCAKDQKLAEMIGWS